MASCPKCGTPKIRRRKDGRRKCRSCGFLPSLRFLDRDGNLILKYANPWRWWAEHYMRGRNANI